MTATAPAAERRDCSAPADGCGRCSSRWKRRRPRTECRLPCGSWWDPGARALHSTRASARPEGSSRFWRDSCGDRA